MPKTAESLSARARRRRALSSPEARADKRVAGLPASPTAPTAAPADWTAAQRPNQNEAAR